MLESCLSTLYTSKTSDPDSLERLIRVGFVGRLLWEQIDYESLPEWRSVQCVATVVDNTPRNLQALLNLVTVRYFPALLQNLPG